MGWDIYAEVEVYCPWNEGIEDLGLEPWMVVVHTTTLLGRDYEAFQTLFGATSRRSGFEPIAANRGLPPDVSKEIREDARQAVEVDPSTGCCWPSWVTLAELDRVDWDEVEPGSLAVLHRFVRGEGGAWISDSAMPVDEEMDETIFGSESSWAHGQEWIVGDQLYRAVYPTRRDTLDEDWWTLFAIMRELAKRSTPEGVRLVVWFYF